MCIYRTNQKIRQIIIGSLYRPPNTKPNDFINQYKHMLHELYKEKNKEIILGMDHSLNLLKTNTHKDTQDFLDINFNNNIFPCITQPTRITKSMADLIDNVFISQQLHKSFDSCIVIYDISDHMPSIVNLHDQKHDKSIPLEFNCRKLTDDKIKDINNLLIQTNWTTLDKIDINRAFNGFHEKINSTLDEIAPLKI